MAQIDTKLIKISSLLHSRYFNMGYREYPSSFSPEYDSWPAKEQWHYERGRQFAAATDKYIPVKTGKKINYRALIEYSELITQKAIL